MSHSEEPTVDPSEMDDLLDEMDSTMNQMGRLFATRHGSMVCNATLSMSQSLTLRVIADNETIKISDLATKLGVKAPAASSMVDSLVKAGMIVREHDSDDRRVWRVRLTDDGLEALSRVEQERREYLKHFLPLLTADEIRTIISIHRKLIDAMTSGDI